MWIAVGDGGGLSPLRPHPLRPGHGVTAVVLPAVVVGVGEGWATTAGFGRFFLLCACVFDDGEGWWVSVGLRGVWECVFRVGGT